MVFKWWSVATSRFSWPCLNASYSDHKFLYDISNKIVHKDKWLSSTNWNCLFVRLAKTEMLCCTYNTKHSSQLFDIKLMWQHQQILRKFGFQIVNIRHATKHTVMLRCRWLQNAFFSISVKHLCLCYAVHLCGGFFCLAFNTLWDFVDKYLFTLSHLRLHLHWVSARKKAPQRPTTIITHNNFFSIKKLCKLCNYVKTHVKNKPKKTPQWNSLAVLMYEKISFPHMPKPLGHMCQLARCSFKKKKIFCSMPALT